ncbi:MAG: PAS domain-containing protein, partial [Alphaproteobacteria bacterium]
MSSVQEFPATARTLTEYEALVTAAPSALDAIPGAVYVCDRDGRLVRYNSEAAALWGRAPDLDEGSVRYCGSYRLFFPDGTPLPHAECPMAIAIRDGTTFRNDEVIIERADGSRIVALVNIRPLRDYRGRVQGAINCLQDITARKELEEEVRRKSSDLDDFFENNATPLHIVSADGIILR